MSVIFNQTNINATDTFVSGGGGGGSNFPSGIITPSIVGLSTINGAAYVPGGGGSVPSNLTVSSLTVTQTGVFGSNLTTNGQLTWSIFNAGASSAILTGAQDNKSTRQPTITLADGTTPTVLQGSAFCAVSGGSGIPFYGGNGGEPYIYTSYNSSNVDILKTENNQVALTNISSINGVPPGGSAPITFLVRPEAATVLHLTSGENFLASTFTGSANLEANSIYRLTFKGIMTWTSIPDSNDWAQLYEQLADGQPPDDTRIYPIIPYLSATYGGNTQEYINLETLFRTTVSTTFDLSLSLNIFGSNTYNLNINWITLQNIGSYS